MSQIKIKQIEGLQSKLDIIDAHLASGSLKSSYQQTAHGFAAGSVIAFTAGSWVLADAKAADKLGRLVVESIEDEDNFTAVQIGNIEVQTWNLTPGTFYMVDESGTGAIVPFIDEKNPEFEYSNPVLQALTATEAQVLPWRPSVGAQPIAQGQEHTQSHVPNQTNGADSPTGITLEFEPFSDSEVQVFLNGIAVTESYGDKTGEVYFSNDGGATAAAATELLQGTELFWNANIGGYDIGEGDSIDLVYERNSLGE